jgi:hypothetical protein
MPVTIPPAATAALARPLGGYYRWRDDTSGISGLATPWDRSGRVRVADIWPEKTRFDFSAIRSYRDAARSNNQCWAMGVRQMATFGPAGLPQWMISEGLTTTINNYPVPKWNDSRLLNYLEDLHEALVDEFYDDDDLIWWECRLNGNWGEGHTSGYGPEPTTATKNFLLDLSYQSFARTNRYITVMTDDDAAVERSRGITSGVNWAYRRDSGGMGSHFRSLGGVLPSNIWEFSPLICELAGDTKGRYPNWWNDAANDPYALGFTNIGNGNFQTNGNFTTAQRNLFVTTDPRGFRCGAQIRFTRVETPPTIVSVQALTVTATLTNVGNARLYEPWHAYLLLSGPATATILLGALGSITSSVASHSRTWTVLAPALSNGTYTARLVVRRNDTARGTRALPLANTVDGDGAIALGSITVQNAATPPVLTPAQVTGLAISDVSADGWFASWSEAARAETYQVQTRITDSGGSFTTAETVNAPTTSASVDGRTENTTYDVRVVGVNTAGSGTPSATATVRTLLETPLNVTASWVSQGVARITLQDQSQANSHVEWECRDTGETAWRLLALTADVTEYLDTTAVTGRRYRARARLISTGTGEEEGTSRVTSDGSVRVTSSGLVRIIGEA